MSPEQLNAINIIRTLHDYLAQRFIYTPDLERYNKLEDWRPSAWPGPKEFVRDDCDGWACTIVAQALRLKVSPSLLLLSTCSVNAPNSEDHLVVLIDAGDDSYVSDLRYAHVMPRGLLPYRGRARAHRMSTQWGSWFTLDWG